MDKDNKTENKIVQTYAEDMARVIEDDKEGLVKKIIRGEEEHELEKSNLSPESKKNKTFMFISLVLVAISFAILSFFIFNKKINTVPVEKQFTPLIFNDKSSYIEVAGLKKDEITQIVFNQANTTSVKEGGVEGIYLTENKKIIGLRRLVTLLKSAFVPGDNTLFVNDNFLMGVVNSGVDSAATNRDGFFILIKVRSALDIFNALRAWEDKMLSDVRGFLGLSVNSSTNYLFSKNFEDGIVENKNARILYDKDGKIALMYVFADENSVVITNSSFATHEIILRLASSQKKQ